MKIKGCFISNSSSSSFTIATKTKLSQDELESVLLKAFKVPKASPLYNMAVEMANILAKEAREMSLDELVGDNCYYKTINELLENDKFFARAMKKGFLSLYSGCVSDDDYSSLEAALCYMGLSYSDNEVMIDKEGGY